MTPKYKGSCSNSVAFSFVIPLFFLNSTNASIKSFIWAYEPGSIISAPEIFNPSAFSNISFSLPIKITFAKSSLIIFSVAFKTLKSCDSGNTIVFLSAFAFCLIVCKKSTIILLSIIFLYLL